MEKRRSRARLALPVTLLLALLAALLLSSCGDKTPVGKAEDLNFGLNERDVALDVGGTVQLELESNIDSEQVEDVEARWRSQRDSIATVTDEGLVTAVGGGETIVEAVVLYDGKEYRLPCVVTVKTEEETYSTYKVRYFTQSRDRGSYDVTEETFEREIGSDVNLSVAEARRRMPGNYTLNTDKSRLSGKVQKRKGACVIEVYYDVAEVTYYVDYYYESATQLGSYASKETVTYKAYAFTKVSAPPVSKDGFLLNKDVPGSYLSSDSVTSGLRLVAYYDRRRSDVTVKYSSGRSDGHYTTVYGYGILNAPGDVFEDDISPLSNRWYLDGKATDDPAEALKSLLKGGTVESRVEDTGTGGYFILDPTSGLLKMHTTAANQSANAYLEGKGSTIWLKAKFHLTGSASNMTGFTLRVGNTSRQIRFQNQGIAVFRDDTYSTGLVGKGVPEDWGTSAYPMNHTESLPGKYSTWAQNNGQFGTKTSAVGAMCSAETASDHDIEVIIYDGWFYYKVDGDVSGAANLSLMDADWGPDTEYEIGFSAWDGKASGDEFGISDYEIKFGDDALRSNVKTGGRVTGAGSTQNMTWQPFTGGYLPTTEGGAAYLYTKEGTSGGISADLVLMNKDNSRGAAGVTVKRGDKSYQWLVEGLSTYRRQANHAWAEVQTYDALNFSGDKALYSADGTGSVSAYVKDDHFYIFYNHREVYCFDLISLFPDYKSGDKIQVGLCTWDASNGLTFFDNAKLANGDPSSLLADNGEELDEWGWFGLLPVGDKHINEARNAGLEFANDTYSQASNQNGGMRAWFPMYGEAKTWQVDGLATRESGGGNISYGFMLRSGDKEFGFYLCGGNTYNFGTTVQQCSKLELFNDGGGMRSFWQNGDAGQRLNEKVRFAVYDDVAYVWVDGPSDADLHPVLRFPLTDARFGGFNKGSDYSVWLCVDGTSGNNHMAPSFKLTEIEVKRGAEVTSQSVFMNVSGKDYTLQSLTDTLDKNVTRWEKLANELTLRGDLLEKFDTLTTKGGGTESLLTGSGDTLYFSANVAWARDQDHSKGTLSGFLLKGSDGNGRSAFWYIVAGGVGASGIRYGNYSFTGLTWGNLCDYECVPAYVRDPSTQNVTHDNVVNQYIYFSMDKNDYIWRPTVNDSVGALNKIATQSYGSTVKIEVAIANNILNIRADGYVISQMPMELFCDKWTPGSGVTWQLGFAQWDSNLFGGHTLTNIEYLTGDAAKAKLSEEAAVEGAELHRMFFESFTGTYAGSQSGETQNVITYMLGKPAPALSFSYTAKMEAKNFGSAAGIAVNSGDETAFVVVDKNNNVYVMSSATASTPGVIGGNSSYMFGGTVLPSEGLKAYSGQTGTFSAAVKGGKLYLSFGGKAAYAITLTDLLAGYKSGDDVRLGAATYAPGLGLARCGDMKYLFGDDNVKVEEKDYTAQPVSGMKLLPGTTSGTTLDEATGTITNTAGQGSYKFSASAKTWLIEGTARRPDGNLTSDVGFGIDIMKAGSTSEYTRFTFVKYGFYLGGTGGVYSYQDGQYFANGTAHDNRRYHFRYDNLSYGGFHYDPFNEHKDAARSTMRFRLAIYDDTLYVWFDTVENPGALQLNARIPLTDSQFGGYPKGGQYDIRLEFDNEASKNEKLVGVVAAVDGDVTSIGNLFTVEGKDYSIAEAAKAIDANITRWGDTVDQTTSIFRGALCEGYEDYHIRAGDKNNYLHAASPQPAYGVTAFLRGRFTRADKSRVGTNVLNSMFGVLIKKEGDTDGTKWRQVLFQNAGIALLTNGYNASNIPVTTDIYKYNSIANDNPYCFGYRVDKETPYGPISEMRVSDVNLDSVITYAVYDNTLYMAIDGFTVVRFPLAELNADWTPGSKYQLSFCQWKANDNGGYIIDNVETAIDDAAKALLATDGLIPAGGETLRMVFDPLTGSYHGTFSAAAKPVVAHALGAPSVGDKAVSFRASLVAEGNSSSLNGFALRQSGKTGYLLFDRNGNAYILDDAAAGQANFDTSSPKGRVEGLFSGFSADFTVVLKGEKLFVLVGGKPCFSVPAADVLPGFSSGEESSLGVATYAPGQGLARFSEVTFYGSDALPSTDGEYPDLSELGAPAATVGFWKRLLLTILRFLGIA